MSKSAYGEKAAAGPSFRRTWDVEEYAQKAKEKDEKAREHAIKAEEAAKQGKRYKKKDDVPKPTELMKAREAPLNLDKDVGKTLLVSATTNKGQPGYFCETCNKVCKDSVGYLDHINGRNHLRRLGQTTKLHRSTLQEVRERIAMLREKSKKESDGKKYDFEKRLNDIRETEKEERRKKKEKKEAIKEQKRKEEEEKEKMDVDEEGEAMMGMMGFAGFGAAKKR
ncbi:hypothetical protein BT69DRAFT_1278927 [Atractiella rhizophila]|nr:hypothetical protein BT69DRAFT_1278927 [Atractiella rhizophila]